MAVVTIESNLGRLAVNFRTSEFVSKAHPDKMADGISALVLQEHLINDPLAHVAAETILSSSGEVSLYGEITSGHDMTQADYERLVRGYVGGLGWTKAHGYDPDELIIRKQYALQSPDIAQGVVESDPSRLGAGDQSETIGFAIRNPRFSEEEDQRLPLPHALSRDLLFAINALRESSLSEVIKPDMKSLVEVSYKDGKPVALEKLVLAVSHSDSIENGQLRELIRDTVMSVLHKYKLNFNFDEAIVNGTGKFVIGGPRGDTGLTGRKIVVDAYGPEIPVGGGAFHGKDPSKVDVTGAYLARWIANQIVGNGLADKCLVRLSWAIGQPMPVAMHVDLCGTEKNSIKNITEMLAQIDTSLGVAIARFGMREIKPGDTKGIVYPAIAGWGPFGLVKDDSERPWDLVVPPDKWKEWTAPKIEVAGQS